MNEENRKIIWKLIQKQGEALRGKLSNHPHHPKGRNSYAHICSLINSEFRCSYKDISNEKIGELKNFILKIKN